LRTAFHYCIELVQQYQVVWQDILNLSTLSWAMALYIQRDKFLPVSNHKEIIMKQLIALIAAAVAVTAFAQAPAPKKEEKKAAAKPAVTAPASTPAPAKADVKSEAKTPAKAEAAKK